MSEPYDLDPLEEIRDMFIAYKMWSSIFVDSKPDPSFLINYLEKVFKNALQPLKRAEREHTTSEKIQILHSVVMTIKKIHPESESKFLITNLEDMLARSDTVTIQDRLETFQVNRNTVSGNVEPTVPIQENVVNVTSSETTAGESASTSACSSSSRSFAFVVAEDVSSSDQHQRQNLEPASYDDGPAAVIGPVKSQRFTSLIKPKRNAWLSTYAFKKKIESIAFLRRKMKESAEVVKWNKTPLKSSRSGSSSSGVSATPAVVAASNNSRNANSLSTTNRQLRPRPTTRGNHPQGNSEVEQLNEDQVMMSNQSSSSENEVYNCSNCGKDYPTEMSLKRHMAYCTAIKKFVCKYCKNGFKINSQLIVHERIHTAEKPYPCRYCEKSFSQLGNAQHHERTHTGEKPYRCRHCPRSFTGHSSRKAHEKIH